MSGTGSRGGTVLESGAARRVINPPLGTGKGGLRLFGDPIQAMESDLTATVLVLADGAARRAVGDHLDGLLAGQRPEVQVRIEGRLRPGHDLGSVEVQLDRAGKPGKSARIKVTLPLCRTPL
jgi:hypothetical protein